MSEPISTEEQLSRWLAGESIHSTTTRQCCPDFSCCKPELRFTEEQRRMFVEQPESRDALCMMALSSAISRSFASKRIHVAGFGVEE